MLRNVVFTLKFAVTFIVAVVFAAVYPVRLRIAGTDLMTFRNIPGHDAN